LSDTDKGSANDSAKELLLADYASLADSLWKNEQSGETRVNWFIGLSTAAAGGLIGLTTAEHRLHGQPLRLVCITTLFALFAFGFVTLFRILKRNETTDGFIADSKAIRQLFKEHFDAGDILRDYHPFSAPGEKKLARKLGGLAHVVLTINSLLLAGMAAAVVYPFGVRDRAAFHERLAWTYVVPIVAFGVAWFAQFWYVQRRDAGSRSQLRGGGIVYRMQGAAAQYLLVGPKEEESGSIKEWLFPKGHQERGEELWETAVREVGEETGTVGRPIAFVGKSQFWKDKKKVATNFYLMEAFSKVEPVEKRRVDWFDYTAAIELLTHRQLKDLLRRAEKMRPAFKEGSNTIAD